MKLNMILTLTLIFFSSAAIYADIHADGSNIFTSDSRTVLVSSTCASPTQITTVDAFVTRTYIVNSSSFTNLYMSPTSTSISTGSFYVPPSTVFTPDGVGAAWWGQLFACSSTSISGVQIIPQNVSVMRTK